MITASNRGKQLMVEFIVFHHKAVTYNLSFYFPVKLAVLTPVMWVI